VDLSAAGRRIPRLDAADLARRLRLRRTGARVVMILGNEGAVFVRLTGDGVAEQRYVATPDPDGRAAAHAVLHADASAPVAILLDVLEQHYRETTIPRVGWNDRRKLLKRKLGQAFGADHVATSLYLGEAAPEEGERRGKYRYFLIGVPITAEIRAWLDLVIDAGNPVEGMALLPVEASALVHDLAERGDTRSAPPVWEVLVTHHRASGFRQIILKNGQLIFTRLTPNLEGDAGVADTVDNIHGEIRSTMTYLRRLGFTDTDSMDLVVLAGSAVSANLDRRQMRTRQLRTLTPADAADKLDLRLAAGDRAGAEAGADTDSSASDDLVAAWYGRRPWARLHLDTPELLRARALSAVPLAAYALAALTVVGAAGYGSWQQLQLGRERAELQELTGTRARLRTARSDFIAARPPDQPRMGEVALVVNSRRALAAAAPVHVPVVRALSRVTGADFVVTGLTTKPRDTKSGLAARARRALPAEPGRPVHRDTGTGDGTAGASAPRGSPVVATATLRYRGDTEVGRKRIAARFRELRRRLAEVLPGHRVKLTAPPFDAAPGAQMKGTAGVAAEKTDKGPGGRITGGYRIAGPSP